MRIEDGTDAPLGARVVDGGVNFAVFSHHAATVDLCLFGPDGITETARLTLPGRTGDIWHGFVPGLGAGALYGLRVDGPFAPHDGHRFNPDKLLLDPYARALTGDVPVHDLIYGYPIAHAERDLVRDTRDSASVMPKCVVTGDPPRHAGRTPERSWGSTFIYEAHVKGLTQCLEKVPKSLRGTYEALADPTIVRHLKTIGVTAIELMPIQAFADDRFLVERGLSNFWGYNTFSFFSPAHRYFGPNGAEGLRQTIGRLHDAGIEIILDVVYNHTAESDHLGPTLSFRGLDNASYYRLDPADRRFYLNDTGTGNTLNVAHPFVRRMVLDSLRFWVEHYGVDGFRFDLMTTLAREEHGFAPDGAFMTALRRDPVLAGVKLIAEPWDIGLGGYQLGAYPKGIAEWNDRFRDDVRRFWRRDAGATRAVAARLLGSADIFDKRDRPAWSSINFVAAHDGFTAADTAAYTQKHNMANGEDNRDGHHENFSDNLGVEGPTDDGVIIRRRKKRVRNLLATVLLSQGTPMLLAGDEMGRSQAGNNNAYAQDNASTWLDWKTADNDLIAFVADLAKLRHDCELLRQTGFLHGRGAPRDVEWLSHDGGPVEWDAADLFAFMLVIRPNADAVRPRRTDDAVLIAVNAGPEAVGLTLPRGRWLHVLGTETPETSEHLPAESVQVFTRQTP